jgi:hypothetical protein
VIVSSASHVRVALERLAEIEEEILAKTGPLVAEQATVKEALDNYVIDKFQAGDGYEDDDWKATKVVGHKRTWDVEKLGKLIPKGIFKNVVKVSVDGEKIDAMVAAGRLDRKKISAAFTEKPNKPYVKITKREKDAKKKGEAEAESLAAKLA